MLRTDPSSAKIRAAVTEARKHLSGTVWQATRAWTVVHRVGVGDRAVGVTACRAMVRLQGHCHRRIMQACHQKLQGRNPLSRSICNRQTTETLHHAVATTDAEVVAVLAVTVVMAVMVAGSAVTLAAIQVQISMQMGPEIPA